MSFGACLLCLLVASVRSDTGRPLSRVVTTKYGALRGFIANMASRQLQPVEVFLGVPYASPPVGSLRFMPPVTPAHWRGVRMADKFGPVCPQRLPNIKNETEALKRMPAGRLDYLRRLLPYLRNQSEDCLYLNIYAPSLAGRDSSKVPVMVFIHGESYEWNAGNPYDGSILASFGNVVVVTLNYRLGVLGFLPASEGSARGNYGLMDQVAALHWVQENIVEFGGDLRNVTIFGQGHGAACVNFLMLSPMAKGLFHRVIMQSGSALSPWAIAHEAISYTQQLAKTLGCPTKQTSVLLECMRLRTVEDIMKVHMMVPDYLTAFGPTVDGIVIQSDPASMMEELAEEQYGQFDLLYGVTRVESYFQISAHEERYGIEAERRDRLLRTLVRNVFNYHLQEIFLTIINEYTDWTRPIQHAVNILDSTIDALGDALIVSPIIRSANFHAIGRRKCFFYVFSYQTEDGDYPQRQGCIQGEDLPYVFGAPLLGSLAHFPKNYSRSEVALAEAVMTYWTNFAKAGDPNTPTYESDAAGDKTRGRFDRILWPQYETVHQKYLMIGMKPKVRDHYHAHRLSFWIHLFPQLHRTGSINLAPEHHLLDDHDNPLSYDGIVRPFHLNPSPSSTVLPTSPPIILLPTRGANTTLRPELILTTSFLRDASTSTVNITDSLAVVMQQSSYSTALSVTIAVGCSLLILNVLIFAGIYYQRDKNKMQEKRNYTMQRPQDGQLTCGTLQVKQIPLRAPPPSPVCHSIQDMNNQILPPPPSHDTNLPPKVPPKPTLVPPRENILAEAQPLLTQGGVKLPPFPLPASQEMKL